MHSNQGNPVNSTVNTSENSSLPGTNSQPSIGLPASPLSDVRFRIVAQHAQMAVAECDASGAICFASAHFALLTGYDEGQLTGMNFSRLIAETGREAFGQLNADLRAGKERQNALLPLLKSDGSEVTALLSATTVHDDKGEWVSTVMIAERRHHPCVEEMNVSLDILDSINEAFFVVDNNWRFTYLNRAAEVLNNRTSGELIGKVLWDEFPVLNGSEYEKLYRRVAAERKGGTVTAPSSFSNKWYEVYAYPAKGGLVAHYKNVTQQVESEKALRLSEESLRTIFNTIDEGFCIVEVLFDENNVAADLRVLECNQLFEEMTGLWGVMGRTVRETVPDFVFTSLQTYGEVALTGKAVRFESSSQKLHRWFSIYASPVSSMGSHKIALVLADITQRKLDDLHKERFLALGSDLHVIGGLHKRFLWVSPAWERVLGYSFRELTSKSWTYFVHPADVERTEQTARYNLAGNTITSWENRYRHKDGSYRWFSWNSMMYKDEGLSYGVATDITERKLAEEALRQSEERYSAIIHQATAGVAEMDLKGNYLFVNKKLCEITGFSEEEMCTMNLEDFVHPDDAERCRHLFEHAVATGKPYLNETRIVCKDKTEAWISETISAISDEQNKPQTMVTVCIDVTDRKTMDQQKDDFIGVASHELKTPVTSLKAFAQILQLSFTQAGDVRSAEIMSKMDKQINRLTVLVHDLLDVARLESNRMEFMQKVFNFREMVLNTVEEVQRTIASHKIVCQPLPEAYVFADEVRTAQVLVNFFNNAVKYSPGAKEIIVSVFVNDKDVVCSVRDFGIGIPVERHQYIFDRFYRVADPSRSTYPGLGLGLYISSEIIRRQQGDIWFNSTVNEGSEFSFRLPLFKQP